MKNTNITLIGMPSAGKTYLGKRLAGKFGKTWVDLDPLNSGGITTTLESDRIIMKKEEKLLLSAKEGNCIFSCSGSSIYSDKGMEHLQDISAIFYLKLPLKVIEKRLGNFENRGVVRAKKLTLQELYKERAPLYGKYADFTFAFNKESAELQFEEE